MNELITQAQAQRVFQIIALASPGAGVIIGALIGRARNRIAAGIIVGVLWGLWGTVAFGLWRMYLTFGKHFGYTSVGSFAVQICIFAGLGVAAGVIIQKAVSAPGKLDSKKIEERPTQEEKLNVS